jgi:hypothetical protein
MTFMPTSQKTFSLSEPSGTDKIPLGTFAYLQERNKNLVYELVVREFLESGLSQVDLAARMGQKPARICRLLGAPGNWTLDTVSDLLFAISGAMPAYSLRYPLDEPPRNFSQPEWLDSPDHNPLPYAIADDPNSSLIAIFQGEAHYE